jgi:hypothetical protein
VNCLGIATQMLYVIVYLKYAVGENFRYSSRLVMIAATIAAGVLLFIIPVVLLSRVWSVKVVGISASTFATGNFLGGIIDVVISHSFL